MPSLSIEEIIDRIRSVNDRSNDFCEISFDEDDVLRIRNL